MKIYRVGGSVRDELLGRPVADRDYVVVGATPEQMLAQGFRPVGRDFPVFLHPATNEEYALARTERKRGLGHRGFVFHAAPDVTLEQDLARRDLTVNAMARDEEGRLIDPYGGAADLERVFTLCLRRPANPFAPVSATNPSSAKRRTLSPERVWQEISRALLEARPSRFFALLHRCGALAQLLPEVNAMFPSAARRAVRGETASRVPLLRALDASAAAGDALAVRYAILAGKLGESAATVAQRSSVRNMRLATAVNRRLKPPAECSTLALLLARHGWRIAHADKLAATELLDLLLSVDALRRPARLEQLLRACAALRFARSGSARRHDVTAEHLHAALRVLQGVDAAAIAAKAGTRRATAKLLRAARLSALRRWLSPAKTKRVKEKR